VVVHTVISATWEVEVGESWSEANSRPCLEKQSKSKRTGGMTQVTEHCHSKLKTWVQSPVWEQTNKQTKKKKEEEGRKRKEKNPSNPKKLNHLPKATQVISDKSRN
jgi:hypothetical protein